MILLHLIDDQYIILPRTVKLLLLVVDSFLSIIMYPICELMSLLLVKEVSTNVYSFSFLISSYTYIRPRLILSFCHLIRLFNLDISSFNGLVVWAAAARSKVASGWQIVAMYAPRACYWMYDFLSYIVSSFSP